MLLKYFDSFPLDQLRRFHVKQYFALRSAVVSNATINREVSFARAAINRVNSDFELKLSNPFNDVKFVEQDYIPSYLKQEDYQKLLQSAKELNYHDLHDYIVLLAMTGCRPQEVRTLEWDNVHFDKKQFIVRNCWSKSKRHCINILIRLLWMYWSDVLKIELVNGFSLTQQLISQLIVIINAFEVTPTRWR